MLERAQKDIDAVLVAAPNHIHAVASLAAIRAGKGVYCEKPLTHSIYEARQSPGRLVKPAWPRRWATKGIQRRTSGRQSSGSATARSARCARCMPGWGAQPSHADNASDGNAASARPAVMGPLARSREVKAISSGLRAPHVPLLVGLWQWHPGQLRMPHAGYGRVGAGPGAPIHHRSKFHPVERRDHADCGDLPLRFSRPWRPASSRFLLVRRWFAPASSRLP